MAGQARGEEKAVSDLSPCPTTKRRTCQERGAFRIRPFCVDFDGWFRISLRIIGAVFFIMGYKSTVEESQ